MTIHFTREFQKHYRKRVKSNRSLDDRLERRLALFAQNTRDPILRNHELKGAKRRLWSISITGDIRAIYTVVGDEIYFLDIGSHNQVY